MAPSHIDRSNTITYDKQQIAQEIEQFCRDLHMSKRVNLHENEENKIIMKGISEAIKEIII